MGKSKWTRRRKWLLIALSLFLLMLISGAVHKSLVSRALDDHLAAVQAKGYPVTLGQLNAYYPEPPVGQNAANHYRKAYESHVLPGRDLSPEQQERFLALMWPVDVADLSEDDRLLVVATLEENKESLEHLYVGAQLDQCRYPISLSALEAASVLENLGRIRPLTRLLCSEAYRQRAEGRREEALKAVDAAFAVAHSLRQEPSVVSQVVRWSMHGLARETLADILVEGYVTPDAGLWLVRATHDQWDYKARSRAIAAERCSAVDMLRTYGREMFVSDFRRAFPKPGRFVLVGLSHLYEFYGMPEADALYLSEAIQAVIEAHASPLGQRLDVIAKAERALDEPISSVFTISSYLVPTQSTFPNSELDIAIDLRSASTIMAIERYRSDTGSLPEQLGDLLLAHLSAVPEDPLTGAPMVYRVDENGYAVYSIGMDGIDSGGPDSEGAGANALSSSDDRGFRVVTSP